MNKIYRLVWNAVLGAWVVASELAKGRHQGGGGRGGPVRRLAVNRAVVCASLSLMAFPVFAAGGISSTTLPTGGTVSAGAGSISRSGSTLTVNQSSQNLSLNWTSFNVGTHGTVDFVQPSSSSIAVNRIGGNSGSQILGHLDANGQVYLINPNGILFGLDAQVNVGGIVASTLDLSDRQLGSGTLAFSGSGTGSIINKGSITANGNLVALIGNQVINQGVISAQLGSVALAGGSAVTLTFSGDQLVGVQVDQSTLNNLVTNGQLIQADGGRVWMTAGAADSLLASAVNNSGVVEARTFENHEGTITLLSGMDAGTTTASGTLDASAPNGGNGGNIDTSGHRVNVAAGATVTTAAPQGKGGNWLIDPADFTIAPSGGNMTGLQLSTSLGSSGSVTIESSSGTAGGSGNINVDDTVTVGGTSSLTLIAADNININGVINVGGTASLNLQTATANGGDGGDAAVPGGTVNVALSASGFSAFVDLGSTSSLTINGNPYTIITTASALQALGGSGYYALGNAIDASSISNFTPIATFSGVFDGLGNTISNLSTNTSEGGGGLFGALTPSSVVSNLGLGGSVSGTGVSTDGLATTTNGTLSNVWVSMTVSNAEISGTNNGTINHAYAFGTVTPTASNSQFGGTHNGGLVGINNGTISNSSAGTTVGGGGSSDGGLVGFNSATGTISNSSASGSMSGGLNNGGLVGQNEGTISNSVATGAVAAGPNNVNDGGLVGYNLGGAISNSYATGPVNGGLNESGGLVGLNTASGTINESFATGSVTGVSGSRNGGLVGYNLGSVSNAYATGSVSGVIAGGLVGINDTGATVTNTYATGAVTGVTTAGGGLVGVNNGTISVSYFDPTTTGQANGVGGGTSTGVTGLSPQQWLTQGPIATDAWDTTSIWVANAGLYPILQSLPYVLVTPSAGTSTYGNTAITAGVGSAQVVIPASWTVPDYPTMAELSPSTPTWVGSATADSAATTVANESPTYLFAGTGVTAAGFQVATTVGTLAVDPAILLETATAASSTYGSTPSGLTGSVTGWVNGQSTSSNASGLTWITPATANSNVGSYAIDGSSGLALTGAAAGNYTVAQAESNSTALTIDPATLIETATPSSSTYGSTPSGLTGTVAGWVNGQSTASNTSGNWTTPATANSNVGNYPIDGNGLTLTGAAAGNYTLQQAASNSTALTIDPATLLETATPANSTYGSNPSGLTGSVTGWVNGQSTASNASGLTWITAATANSNVGSYAIDGSGLTLTGAATGNYTLQQAPSNSTALTIDPATLLETATATSSTYGSTPSGLTGSVTGWVNGQSTASNTSGNWATPATANSNVGSYAIDGSSLTLTGAAAGNYTLQQAPSNSTALTIDPATLTETATAASSTYGSAPSGLTGSVTGWVNGQSTASNTSGNWTTPATANSNVGTYAIDGSSLTLTGAAAGNYTLQQAPSNSTALTIDPATLLETATAASSTYGSAPSGLTGNVTGWVNGQSTASNASGLTWITAATANSNVGSYAIDGSGLTLTGAATGNYTLQQAPSNSTALTIDPATLLETATATSSTYGSTPSGLTGSVTGWVNGQSTASNTSGNWATPATANSNVGSYAIDGSSLTLTGAAAGNYTLQQAPSNSTALTIDPATLTETATAVSSTYGSTPSGLTGSVTGWANGQSTASNASGLAWTTAATANNNVGTYAIDSSGLTLTGAAAGNYTVVQAPSNSTALTIDPATLLETATAASSTYGSTPSGLTGSITGWVNGQSTTSNTSGNWTTPATANSNVGNYAIDGSGLTLTGAAAGNYTLQQAASNGTALTIDPATLLETATAASSTYGSTPSGLTGSITGWVNGQSSASNTSGNWSTPATANSNVGTYAINGGGLTLTGAAAGNYTLQQAASNGTALTIDPATLLETATPASITFGSTPSGLTGSVTGWVNGQSTASNASGLTWITPATANSNVGNYAIDGSDLTLTGAADGNYTLQQAASNSTALTINPSPVTQTSQSYVSTILTNGGDLTNGGALTNGGIVPSQATPEPTIAPVQIPAGSAASTSGNAAGPQVNMTQAIGGNGTLVVIDNGVNLSSVPQSSATPASWERTSCAVH